MNDKITAPAVWVITRTEYAGQCTGFSSETICLGIFTKKPDLKTLAPFIGRHLPSDMGQAIAQVQELIDKGNIHLNSYDFELDHVMTDTILQKDS